MTSTSSSSHRSSLLSDKGCVVMDIGNFYTKYAYIVNQGTLAEIKLHFRVGMSGEPCPRFIIPSKTRIKSSGKVSMHKSATHSYVYITYKQLVNVMDRELLRTPQKLTKIMSSFMKDIYLK